MPRRAASLCALAAAGRYSRKCRRCGGLRRADREFRWFLPSGRRSAAADAYQAAAGAMLTEESARPLPISTTAVATKWARRAAMASEAGARISGCPWSASFELRQSTAFNNVRIVRKSALQSARRRTSSAAPHASRFRRRYVSMTHPFRALASARIRSMSSLRSRRFPAARISSSVPM